MRKTSFQIAKQIVVSFLFFSIASCSYSFEDSHSKILMVSNVQGDKDGRITSSLIRQVTVSGLFCYQNHSADRTLSVKIKDRSYETIGYRKDRRKDVSILDNILACEERQIIKAEVVLFDEDQNELFPPIEVSAYVDYDYVDDDSLNDLSFIDSSGVRQTNLTFSLGQLVPVQSAREAATDSLYTQLAQKIVDVISVEW